jgi:hypothetical protein
MTDKTAVFISHIGEEAALAHSLKSWIESTFPDQVTVFVSSDLVSIEAGDEWYDKIMEALRAASVLIDETVKLLQDGNSAFHEAANKLIDDVELRVKSIAAETSWDIKHGGDSHSEYVCYRQGYTSSCFPKMSLSTRRTMLRFESDSLRGGCSPWWNARP